MMSLSDIASPPTNYIGTALFIGYIAAALALTFILILDLFRQYRDNATIPVKSPSTDAQTSRIFTFVALAALSFTLLSCTMSNVLIQSYIQFQTAENSPLLGPSTLR